MEPWTRRLRISWRPTLGFFEGRYDVLRRFEEQGLLQNFRVEEGRIAVRLGDAAHVVAFGPGRIELSMLRPDASDARMHEALALLVKALSPGPARMSLGVQALEPLALDYATARNRAIRRVFPALPAALQSDFAFTLESLQGPEVRWALDAGIVDRADLPPRLSRERTRLGHRDPDSHPGLWPLEQLPEVALFCDGEFDRIERVDDPGLDQLVRGWDALSEHADEVVRVVFRRLNPMEES